MTMLAIVVFGFIAFGMIFMGMMCVLPGTVSHPHPKPTTGKPVKTRSIRPIEKIAGKPAGGFATFRSA